MARKGGEAVSRNRKHMAEIGRKGGEAVSQDRRHMAEIGRKGGEAVSQNREHMAEIGRKGGEARSGHGHPEDQETSDERSPGSVHPIRQQQQQGELSSDETMQNPQGEAGVGSPSEFQKKTAAEG
ncbi:MAG: general stress protein [Bdellovibrionota bacterium]